MTTLMPPPPGEPWPPPAVSPETGHAVGHPMNTRRVNRIRRAAGIRRCWLFHRWRHVNFIGLGFLVEHQRCARCGYERCVQVVP